MFTDVMTPATASKTSFAGLAGEAFRSYREVTGQSPVVGLFIVVLNCVALIVFHRELAQGEFGTLNTALGVLGLMTVPVLAVNRALAWHLARNVSAETERIAALRSASLLITETFAWVWGLLAFVLFFIVLSLLGLPRFSLELLVLINGLIAIGGLISAAVCQIGNQMRLWGRLLIAAALTRLLLGGGLAWTQPWSDVVLAAFLVAGFILLGPALDQTGTEMTVRIKALRAALDRPLLIDFGATLSVLLGIFLFINADRIVAQSWFGSYTRDNMGFVDMRAFDAYQTAGLLGRALLWTTQPLLLVMFAQRSLLDRTTLASLKWFWTYLGALFGGAILLGLLRQPLSWLFCGSDFSTTAAFVPNFAIATIPLGLLQGLGIFALASRRYQECFVFGGCGVAYTLLLYLVGRQPVLMLAYMFGAGLVALMILLFVGVVRWGRKQP